MTFSLPHKFFFLKYFIKSSLSQYCYDFSQQQLQLPFQRWFCAALCPRQCASGCCAQPLPPFGLSSLTLLLLFSALSSAAVSALITMLCGKVASQEVAVSRSSSCVPHDNPQLQTGLSVFSGRQQIGLFGSVFPPDFCISLRHGASMSPRFPIWLVKNKRDDLTTTAAWSFKEIFNYKQETFIWVWKWQIPGFKTSGCSWVSNKHFT